ncbi:DUF3325 domain-containing protein [Chitinimonas koreensis]|uniref:DUF3325 domain-containing protein n=1 Tax=Chitinimonas koreensis TaxID=356302 RepID=UPI00042A8F53|nr:DUF3325 domain-containing protein [Chitinimonas koreensis]QNM95737.1 DUF3325 domain-containing protein [Chitinimonas koreensis]
MAEPIWLYQAGAAAASVVGFAWLSLAMDAHWHQVHGGTTPARAVRATLRALGTASLLASALLCFAADRPSMAVLVWLMLLAGSAPLIALTLAFRPRLLRAAWPWGDRIARGR